MFAVALPTYRFKPLSNLFENEFFPHFRQKHDFLLKGFPVSSRKKKKKKKKKKNMIFFPTYLPRNQLSFSAKKTYLTVECHKNNNDYL